MFCGQIGGQGAEFLPKNQFAHQIVEKTHNHAGLRLSKKPELVGKKTHRGTLDFNTADSIIKIQGGIAMKGSVRKRGSTWSYRIDLGRMDGKRNQIEKGGFRTKREADKALTDALYQFNNTGDYVENQRITLSEVYAEFMEKEAEATRAYATIKRYRSLYKNHYKEPFGCLYMYQISCQQRSGLMLRRVRGLQHMQMGQGC